MKLSQAAAAPGPSRNAAATPASVDAIATVWVCRPPQNPPAPAASTATVEIVPASTEGAQVGGAGQLGRALGRAAGRGGLEPLQRGPLTGWRARSTAPSNRSRTDGN